MIIRCSSILKIIVVILQLRINKALSFTQIMNDQKIVGGQTTVETAPYQISLQALIYDTPYFQHYCGGAILSKKHIITSAHCLTDFPIENLTVVVGTSIWDVGGVRHTLEKLEIHENYQRLETSDIGIVTLKEPLTFNDKVQPIAFNDDYVPGDVPCILTGWGYTIPIYAPSFVPNWFLDFLRLYPKDLKIAQLKTVSNNYCRFFINKPLETELCTYRWSRGACAGDSGGPLVNMERNLLIGIVSFGSFVCGGYAGVPDAHTRISNFTTWIRERIKVN